MKFLGFFCIALFALCVETGCSDSTPPVVNYPLTLSIVGDTSVPATLSVLFSLRVTKNGLPFAGATLIQTDEGPQHYNIFKRPGVSDSNGKFTEFAIYYLDTVTEAAFQAIKDTVIANVKDTLESNTIVIQMP